MGLFGKRSIKLEALQEIERKSLQLIDIECSPYYIPEVNYEEDDRYPKREIPEKFISAYGTSNSVFESKDIRYYRDFVSQIVVKEMTSYLKQNPGLNIASTHRSKYTNNIIDDIIDTESEVLFGLFVSRLIIVD